MRNPGTGGNLNIVSYNMMVDPPENGFPHIPDFAWISQALPLNT